LITDILQRNVSNTRRLGTINDLLYLFLSYYYEGYSIEEDEKSPWDELEHEKRLNNRFREFNNSFLDLLEFREKALTKYEEDIESGD
jgi:hypothetical protein